MYDEACRAFLQKPLIARMSTIDPDGYPHTVPVWFKLDGDDLVVIVVRSTRKIGHIQANPKGSLSIGGDDGDGGGYLIKGEFVLEEDPDDRWVRALCHQYEPPDKAEADVADWADLDIILARLKPRSVYKTA
ncbi:pyridoxamine 5'-phosphate oxidase family protein [Aggregatilinea lenta]|uniref:pyridoxamine 5'-phosphate oxidase family protein n=1 Tax=Aggregatilinea lenta TaxID=913108 RepID=UPI000E5AE5F8|nr:pyridoxamine 5'-phosphate oxidase family protein [Aggregatilinea lenta]